MSSREHTKSSSDVARSRGCWWIAFASLLVSAGGCATTDKDMPTEQFTRAQDAIRDSEEHGAREKSASELVTAQEHYQKAKAAAADKDYGVALLYAEKAEADAKLAEARAERADAETQLHQVQENIRVLENEVNRQLDERSQEQQRSDDQG
jgi:hypothetical protein